jgi:hypothetical protein
LCCRREPDSASEFERMDPSDREELFREGPLDDIDELPMLARDCARETEAAKRSGEWGNPRYIAKLPVVPRRKGFPVNVAKNFVQHDVAPVVFVCEYCDGDVVSGACNNCGRTPSGKPAPELDPSSVLPMPRRVRGSAAS